MMKNKSYSQFYKLLLSLIFIASLSNACKQNKPEVIKDAASETTNPKWLHIAVRDYTDVLIDDLFNPPVASRNYVYPLIACYEVMRYMKPEYMSLHGQLKDMPLLPVPDLRGPICYPIAAVEALYMSGNKFVFSKASLEAKHTALMVEYRKTGLSEDVLSRSVNFGRNMAIAINEWADKDNYSETRSMPKYTTTNKPGFWRPTPPDYLDALEPNWSKMRLMVLDSNAQFAADPPLPFSVGSKSSFYDAASEIRAIGVGLNPNKAEIARFWDDNPVVTVHQGHAVYDKKKMTPGGHWLNIVRQACEKTNKDIFSASEAYVLSALALYDGFITSWTDKYKYQLVRPETYINSYMDPNWKPFLQTPPFPEHTSGHSVISGAVTEVCTMLFGENFSMIDSTELEFGHGVRSLETFRKAAEEVSVSRCFGGIHYRQACDAGLKQGRQIGKHLINKIRTRSEAIGQK